MTHSNEYLRQTPVTVIGAGVAGLAVAIAARQRGADVTVFEQAPEITEVGAGLQISPNGIAVLDALGLGDAARKMAVPLAAVELIDGLSGRRVIRMAMDQGPRPYLAFHRADLIDLLAEGARDQGVVAKTGHRVSVDEMADASGLVFGADGLHSELRGHINGATPPFFTGQVAWRAVVPNRADGAEPVARVFMGPGQHLVTYPLRGGAEINLVAVREEATWREEGWALRGDERELRDAFSRFCPEARALLAQVEAPGVWGLFRHPIAGSWHMSGRLAILGDAAHPTLPFLAQGANMALEDAWVLADRVDRLGADEGLPAYEKSRKPRVTRAIEMANQNARNYHLRGVATRGIAHNLLRLAGATVPSVVSGRFDWLYAHDVTKDTGP